MGTEIKQRLDRQKAVEVLLYVTKSVANMYSALKVLYFADRRHLAKYGRLIYGDGYVAMSHGPVPSAAYDIIKAARGDGFCPIPAASQEFFRVDEHHHITALRAPDLDQLSESDRECLDTAIREYGHLEFNTLKEKSHDQAFLSADQNDFIPIEAIVSSLPEPDLLLDYLKNG